MGMNPTSATIPHPSVLITGASSGLGMACALEMDRLGWRVFAGVRSPQAADRIVEQAKKQNENSRLSTLIIDITIPESINNAAAELREQLGAAGLDALVNNAGIAVSGPLEIVHIAQIRRQLEVNVVGQAAVTQAMLPLLRAARGRIVNMGSVSGFVASPYLGAYCMSKYALEAFSDSLRVELAPWGISVSLVEPMSISSDIWDKALADIERLRAETSPAGRELYDEVFDKMLAMTNECQRTALPVTMVVKAVRHALTARRPKTRYFVAGPLGKVLVPLFSNLPDRLRDWLIRRVV